MRRLLSDAVLSRVSLTDAELDAYSRAARPGFRPAGRSPAASDTGADVERSPRRAYAVSEGPQELRTLAQTRSRAPEASAAGAMGTFGRGELPAELEAAAFGLAAGETSDVVQSPLGYHVLRVEERGRRATGLPQCREAARAVLLRQNVGHGVREFVRA